MFRSATLRLTLWYLAIVMFISLLFSFALFSVTTNELNRGLHSESQSLYNQFPVFQNDPHVNFKPKPYFDTSEHRILLRLIGFNVIVLFAAGFSSYWLAKRTLEPIEAAHHQQKRFTSDVSHELRTPLTAIKMESEVALLNDQAPAKELRATLESNLEEVGKLEVLINNLLRLSRLEADELQQNFQKTNTEIVIAEAIDKVKKAADSHSIEIDTKGTSEEFFGDKESITQLISILIDNSIKYSPNGSRILVSNIKSKDSVTIKVKDEGVGIDPLALQHVFDRFYRADNSRTKTIDAQGFGLGLSIAKMIADVHKANITLTSKVGQGTTATIIIPKNITA
jgi:signal transduction histidine kinase